MTNTDTFTRDEAIAEIKRALRSRSGKSWSVKGGRGTAWGWISISAPPARLERGSLTEADRLELSELLGVTVHSQGESVPAQSDFRAEYIDRANGRTPSRIGSPQWD